MSGFVLVISGILIGAGIGIIWRDIRRARRSAFVVNRDAPSGATPEVEITIAQRARGAQSLKSNELPAGSISAQDPQLASMRPKGLEQQWSELLPVIEEGVAKVNAVLTPVRISIADAVAPAWSLKNKGYGSFRRLMHREQSLAWLRLEVSRDGLLHASVKAHKDDLAQLNTTCHTEVHGLNATRIGDLLSECLKPAAAYAGFLGAEGPAEGSGAEPWTSVDGLVTAALQATNGALAQAGAQLVPLAPAAWHDDVRRHRLTLAVDVAGHDIARMHIDRLEHEIEVAVGVRDAHLVAFGRRRRAPVSGLSTHALAEVIASCAWPSIARFRETLPSA